MSVSVDFIYDPECPNAKTARANLMTALSRAGVAPRWVEHLAGAPSTPVEVRSFGSPTVLVDGRDVAGDAPASAQSCRRYDGSGAPSVELIHQALRGSADTAGGAAPRPWLSRAAILPGLGVALMPKVVCPLCWPAYAGVLGAMGLGFLMEDRWLLPISAIFLALLLLALGWRARSRRGFGPLAVGAIGAALVLVGKFALDFSPAAYAGVATLFAACVWNAWPRRASDAECSACVATPATNAGPIQPKGNP
jgi:mercuric ion transport protein